MGQNAPSENKVLVQRIEKVCAKQVLARFQTTFHFYRNRYFEVDPLLGGTQTWKFESRRRWKNVKRIVFLYRVQKIEM